MTNKYLIFLVVLLSLTECQTGLNQETKKPIEYGNFFPIDSVSKESFQNKIHEANSKFKVKDTTAIRILSNIKEINEILQNKYSDTTIKNDLIIFDVPTDSIPYWYMELYQFQPKIGISHLILSIKINATNSHILIYDLNANPDKELTLNEWIRYKNKK